MYYKMHFGLQKSIIINKLTQLTFPFVSAQFKQGVRRRKTSELYINLLFISITAFEDNGVLRFHHVVVLLEYECMETTYDAQWDKYFNSILGKFITGLVIRSHPKTIEKWHFHYRLEFCFRLSIYKVDNPTFVG